MRRLTVVLSVILGMSLLMAACQSANYTIAKGKPKPKPKGDTAFKVHCYEHNPSSGNQVSLGGIRVSLYDDSGATPQLVQAHTTVWTDGTAEFTGIKQSGKYRLVATRKKLETDGDPNNAAHYHDQVATIGPMDKIKANTTFEFVLSSKKLQTKAIQVGIRVTDYLNNGIDEAGCWVDSGIHCVTQNGGDSCNDKWTVSVPGNHTFYATKTGYVPYSVVQYFTFRDNHDVLCLPLCLQ